MQRYEKALNSKDIYFKMFIFRLRDAIFVNNQEDIDRVLEMWERRNNNIERTPMTDVINKGQVRRHIPDKETLAERVQGVVDYFEVYKSSVIIGNSSRNGWDRQV